MSDKNVYTRLQAELSGMAAGMIEDIHYSITVRVPDAPAEIWELADPGDEDFRALDLQVDDDAILLQLKGTDTVVEAYIEVTVQRAKTRIETLPIRLLNAKSARRRDETARRETGTSAWRDGTEPAWIAETIAEAEAAEAAAGEKTE